MSRFLRNLPQRVKKYDSAPARRLTTGPGPIDQFGPSADPDEQLGQLSDVEKDYARRRMPVDGVGK